MSTGTHSGADLGASADAGPATEAMQVVPPPPAAGEPGWLLGGRYRVVDRIGSGGMAEVFRAHDQLLARDVAVKVFRSHSDPEDATGGVQRQELELQTLARLSHPNLITLFDGSIGSDGEPAFLVMELIEGPSLAARIAQAPLTEPETREIAIQIAGALAYVHSQHMVHRDIKPANILLGADGTTGDTTVRARLSDFGIVRLLGSEHLTSADFMIGTASYLAPEQARGAEVGPAADIYALGLVLIEAITGRRSYQGPALEAVLARLDRSPEIPVGLPYPWPELLPAMTAMSPEQRPSAAEVARALRDGTAIPPPMLAGAGTEVFAGLAGAAAGGAALASGAAAALAGGVAAQPGAIAQPGEVAQPVDAALANAGLAGALSGAAGSAAAGSSGAQPAVAAPGVVPYAPAGLQAADPELATAFIGTPAVAQPEAAPPDRGAPPDQPRRRGRVGGKGPLAAAVALLVAALATGGFLMVRQPAGNSPGLLPGQAVASDSSKPASAKPTATRTSLAPVGSVPTGGGNSSGGSRPARSSSASSSSASSSAAASSSASVNSSAPASSSSTSAAPSASSSAVPSASSSVTSSGSSSAGTSGSPSTSASPVAATSPASSASGKKSGRPTKSG